MTTNSTGRYSHIFFDFDGVICDSLTAAVEVFNRLQADSFPQLPPIRSREDLTVVYAGSLGTCLHRWLSPEDSRRFFDLHSRDMAAQAAHLQAFPGIGTVLATLGESRVSIVTSAYSEAVRSVLAKEVTFNERCLHMIAGRELRQSKTEKITAILATQGIPVESALYVGDLESDILYCRDVPIDIVAVGYGYHPGTYLVSKEPSFYVESIDELQVLLTEICSLNTAGDKAILRNSGAAEVTAVPSEPFPLPTSL